jgi:vacuolar protein sorting-associated protein 52
MIHMACYSSFFWQVNDAYVRNLEILSKKLKFVQVDPLINASKALKDVKAELERLRQRALSKVTFVIYFI